MNSKSIQILVAIIAGLVVVAFAATKLKPSAAAEEQRIDSSEDIERLETDLMVANVLYLKAKVVALGNASTFMDTMARKLEGDASESEYQRAKSAQQESQLEMMIASEKARTLYLSLKKIDPNNKKLLEIRDAGRVKGGVSPYDD